MKKNVIALAVAAAMTAPLAAQAEVTVSGQLQAEITSLSGDNVTEGLYMHDAQEGGNPGSGNFGAINFSATEDLGGGMKALAKYSFNVDIDGKDPVQRDSYVGLSGGFGTVLAGTMSSPYKSSTVKWDPFLATAAQARGNYGMSTLHNGYVGNALAYANKFGPVKVVGAVVFDETADGGATPADSETTGNHAFSFSVNAPVGPVELAFAYFDASDYGAQTQPPLPAIAWRNDDFTAMKVGAKFAAGAFSAALQYENLEEGNGVGIVGVDPETTETDHIYANGTFTAGANTFAAAYGQQEVDGSPLTQTYASLGMIHNFSKTTSAHVTYIQADPDDGSDETTGVTAGMRVKF